jgi:hypothetical protein
VTRPTKEIKTRPSPIGDQELIALSPPRTLLNAEPGQAESVTITIANRTRSPEQLKLVAELLEAPTQSNSFAQIVVDPDPNQAQSWVKLPTNQLNLDQEQQAEISVGISVTQDARPGVHAVALVAENFSSAPSVNTDESARVGLTSKLVGQIIINVAGDKAPDIRVTGQTSDRFVWPREKVRLGIRVTNQGNTLGTISGRIRIGNITGKSVGSLTIPETQLLPSGERVVTRTWNDRPWIGWYKPKATVDTGTDGKKTVELPRVFLLPQWWVFVLLGLAIVIPLSRYVMVRQQTGSSSSDTPDSSNPSHPPSR